MGMRGMWSVVVAASCAAAIAASPAVVAAAGAGAGAAAPTPPTATAWWTAEMEALSLAWGRPVEQREVGLSAHAREEAARLRNLAFPAEDRSDFVGRPRLTLARFLPEIFEGDPWRSAWPATESDGTHERIHFVNRNGAKLTGDLWGPPATTCAPTARCAGILVVEGGAGASARAYWWAAQTLAMAGYVVLTFDVQGQGESETFGHDASGRIACMPPTAVPDDPAVLRELGSCGGVPSEQPASFTLAAEDAYDWFVSAANPWAGRIDTATIGAAGHSWGATAVTTLQDRRSIGAIVAWDWLSACPVDVAEHGVECPAPESHWIPARAPALDIEGDFLYWPLPRPPGTARDGRLEGFGHWSRAGVDVMTLVLRGGTHYDYASVPLPLPALRDGQALAARFTRLWFDKYLRRDPSAAAALTAPAFRMQRWDPVGRTSTVDIDLSTVLSTALDSASRIDGVPKTAARH